MGIRTLKAVSLLKNKWNHWTSRPRYNKEYCIRLDKELQQYKELEEQGLVKKFPCKVGDVLWMARVDKDKVDKCIVSYATIYQDEVYMRVKILEDGMSVPFRLDDIGKYPLFLTEEEAQMALWKELKDNHFIKTVVVYNDFTHPQMMLFEVPSPAFNIQQAVKAAIIDYCKTEQGAKFYHERNGMLNWYDLANHIPSTICNRHGFQYIKTITADTDADLDILLEEA